LGTLGPIAHSKMSNWEKVFRVTVLANVQLIRTLDPLLRASTQGRVFFITSRTAREPRAYWGAYAAAKSALESLAHTYALENTNTSLRVHTVNPGKMRTAMRATAYPGENPDLLPTPDMIAEKLMAYCLPTNTAAPQHINLQTDSLICEAQAARPRQTY
jgi:NAD(P)-dependent dehydrogenase (short-subunit alcohol dehydrogenase family)